MFMSTEVSAGMVKVQSLEGPGVTQTPGWTRPGRLENALPFLQTRLTSRVWRGMDPYVCESPGVHFILEVDGYTSRFRCVRSDYGW